ncbi:hypothetical protein MMC07_005549 [Pseudocyphellaria aurata]|nr:hypothetical protein [Pseudocyphellaria aurata]
MKYGETLQQRSIPLWENYNIDYNDIKYLIKAHTTRGQAQAVTVPGKDNEAKALQKFEDRLYAELWEQHQRIDLFVQSKAGEITRRLLHLDKQIAQLEKRNASSKCTKIPVRRLERFSKAEEATLKAGDEIQSLSRFVGAQRLAFQKLLKKYKRWTGSAELGRRFHKEVLGRPNSFSRRDFGPLLTQWTEVLAAVRAPFSAGVQWRTDSIESQDSPQSRLDRRNVTRSHTEVDERKAVNRIDDLPTSAAHMHATCETGSSIDVDTALAILPLGRRAGKASYWIHPDNLVEIHILLLQFTRVWGSVRSPALTGASSSSRSSRNSSINGRGAGTGSRSEDEIGVIICDDLPKFAKRQSAATISDSENIPGQAAEKAAASIRYAAKGDAVVVVGTSPDELHDSSAAGPRPRVQKARFKKKALRDLFDVDTDSAPARIRSGSSHLTNGTEADQVQRMDAVRTWIANHQEVEPLVQILSKRSRFVGLGNGESGGVWATLDKDVSMRRCSSKTLDVDQDLLTCERSSDADKFPHAILEIRYEGHDTTKLVSALDESHLTERVRGFSLETHAVARLCQPEGMPRPYWIPALDHDIRKIPAPTKGSNRRGSTSPLSAGDVSTGQASASGDGQLSSGFSAPMAESSATSAPDSGVPSRISEVKKKRSPISREKKPLRRQLSGSSSAQHPRYWNEFDDGDEGSENEAYTIFVDPNARSTFPGAAALGKAIGRLTTSVKPSCRKVRTWLGSSPKSFMPEERQALIDDEYRGIQPSAEEDNDCDPGYAARLLRHRHYSTMSPPAARAAQAVRSRDHLLSRACVAFFFASFALLLLANILNTTGRRRDAATVDLGVIVGVIASLVFAVVAVGTMVGRTEDLGWLHRALVLVLFALDCVGCAVLIVVLGSA